MPPPVEVAWYWDSMVSEEAAGLGLAVMELWIPAAAAEGGTCEVRVEVGVDKGALEWEY